MNKLTYYKPILAKCDLINSPIGYKISVLINHYQEKDNKQALETLFLVLQQYAIVSDNNKNIEIRLPETLESKINKLYEKKIQTFSFGAKTIESMVDDLINQND